MINYVRFIMEGNMIKKIGKSLINKAQAYDYHLRHKTLAKKTLKSIELVKGKTDPKLIKLSDQYASDVLGWIGFSPWLYVYSAISENFKEGWIPDNYYGKIVVPSLKGKYGDISNLNSLQTKLFESDLFPDIAYYVNGLWTSNDYRILSEDEVKGTLFKSSDKIVYKIDNSWQGRGIFFFSKTDFSTGKIKALGNGVVQAYIKQHRFFAELMPNSVVTLRITTVIDDAGNISVRSSCLRIGRESDSHVHSKTYIRVPVDPKTGELYKNGYTSDWLAVEKHPDTNVLFAKKQLPAFDKCVHSAIELHKRMPFARTIGWDMSVDENDNVKIMEWNGSHNGILFSEATQGPCFSDLGWEKLWKKL